MRVLIMNKEATSKLWVTKFCLKVVYPKFNYYIFLVFLAIKYRIYTQRRKNYADENMDIFEIKTIPYNVHENVVCYYLEENLHVLSHKCIIISREQFIQLSSQNLFYLDSGIVWLAMKLTKELKKKHKQRMLTSKEAKKFTFNINFSNSESQQKLLDSKSDLDMIRIVPVVGSKKIPDNVAYVNENELYSIVSSFGLPYGSRVKVTFHPVPALKFGPNIASMAEVNLLVNDYDLSNDFLKEVLSNYFSVPKLLNCGDTFSIDLTQEITDKYHYKHLDLVETTGRLYFKCNKLTSDKTHSNKTSQDNVLQPFYVVKGVTQLNLGENIHNRKPKDEYFTVKDNRSINFLHACPTGLKTKFDQMQETITPFLTEEINDLTSHMSSPIIPLVLLTGSLGSGRHLLVDTIAKYNGLNCLQIDCNALQSSTAKQTESKINAMVQKAKAAAPVIALLDNFDVFAVDPENNEDCRIIEYFMNTLTDLYQNYTKHAIILVAVSDKQDLKPNVLRIFLEKIHIPRLNLHQRLEMLQWITEVMGVKIDGEEKEADKNILNIDNVHSSQHTKDVLQRVAAKTETFVYGDIDTLLHFALRESYLKQQKNAALASDPDLHSVEEEDFNTALEAIRKLQSQNLDAPKIPKVHWEDIGGLEKLKKELMKTIEFPIKYPHLFKNSSLKRSGILLYGPPGCGKTLVAKAVSTELNISFLSVKGPELLNMYIGQSEENVRKVFSVARASSPCVVFLDELDALAPRRGAAGDSAGASDRLVAQLLAELDAVTTPHEAESNSFVFVMGATNRPDLLEQSLLRPGRLDKLIYVGPYEGIDEKTSVLNALCRSYKLEPDVELRAVSAALPARCTGADLLHVAASARAAAVRRLVRRLQTGDIKESELNEDSVVVGVSELYEGVETFRPSVTDEELAYYESLKSQI